MTAGAGIVLRSWPRRRAVSHIRFAGMTLAAGADSLLLLRALGRAIASPDEPPAQALTRLVWCLPALAALAYLCGAESDWPAADRGAADAFDFSGSGLGPGARRALAVAEAAVACVIGALLAAAAFLAARYGVGVSQAADRLLGPATGAGGSLPPAAPIALLVVVPLVGALAAALAPRGGREPAAPAEGAAPAEVPAEPVRADSVAAAVAASGAVTSGAVDPGLVGLTPAPARASRGRLATRREAVRSGRRGAPGGGPAVGLALPGLVLMAIAQATAAGHGTRATRLPLLGPVSLPSIAGWLLAAAGCAVAVPALLVLVGRLLAARPGGVVRLLAGRGLQAEAHRIAGPTVVLTLTLTAVFTAGLRWAVPAFGWGVHGPAGPVPVVEAVLTGGSVLLVLALRVRRVRARRADEVIAPLRALGASRGPLRAAAGLRAATTAATILAAAALSALLSLALTH